PRYTGGDRVTVVELFQASTVDNGIRLSFKGNIPNGSRFYLMFATSQLRTSYRFAIPPGQDLFANSGFGSMIVRRAPSTY
ncbi:MAG: hypothetical protein AABY22_07945, partial [Nanoarchaeota archaeon]